MTAGEIQDFLGSSFPQTSEFSTENEVRFCKRKPNSHFLPCSRPTFLTCMVWLLPLAQLQLLWCHFLFALCHLDFLLIPQIYDLSPSVSLWMWLSVRSMALFSHCPWSQPQSSSICSALSWEEACFSPVSVGCCLPVGFLYLSSLYWFLAQRSICSWPQIVHYSHSSLCLVGTCENL